MITNVSSIFDGTKYQELDGAISITTTTIGGSTYALVASRDDDGVQIINITDPYNPTNASSITNGTRYPTLGEANSITTAMIGGSTYALVASLNGDGGVQIINITDPYNPTNASSISDGTRYTTLNGSASITTATIEGSTYALVAAGNDDGVQIINITDPYNPINASSITDGIRYPELDGAIFITTATIEGSTYALVGAYHDHGVQIINIMIHTTPLTHQAFNGTSYPTLKGASSIIICHNRELYLRLVAATNADSIQTINITDPYNPINTSRITDGIRYPNL